MKKPPPPAPSLARNWRLLAVGSLLVNGLLALGLWRAPVSRPASPAPASAPAAVSARGPYAALGSFMAENNRIADLGWSEAQFAAFLAGFRSSYEGRGLPLDDEAKRLRDDISRRVQAKQSTGAADPVEEYFHTLESKEGVRRTASGLRYRITEPSSGPTAKATDTVVISFAARLPEGQALPALTRARTKTRVQDLLPGLAEGVQLLPVGGKALIYLAPALAFSEADWPPQLPRHTPLAFFIELHDIVAP